MLYREIIAVCSQIHTKHINTLCGQKAEFLNVKPGGPYNDHCNLKGEIGHVLVVTFGFLACKRSMTVHTLARNVNLGTS
jgi:hypothetical protein